MMLSPVLAFPMPIGVEILIDFLMEVGLPAFLAFVLVAVGLVHLSISEGRILRVCGEKVTAISEKSVAGPIGYKMKMTEAFYGLVPAVDGGFWGITYRVLYRFGADGKIQKEFPLPKLKSVSGVYLSRDVPGAIIIRTDVNWAVSTSGYTPLVVPSEN